MDRLTQSVSATAFASLDFAGLLVVTTIAEFLHRAFLVHFLLQSAQCALDRFTFAAFDI